MVVKNRRSATYSLLGTTKLNGIDPLRVRDRSIALTN